MRKSIAALFGLCAFWAAAAGAQDYPNKPITLLVGFPPGGNTDITARALVPDLSKALGQSIVVVNKGGAGGVIGSAELARARPDGYTIALSPNSALTLQTHLQKAPYTLDSFRFACLTYDNTFVLMRGKDVSFKTLPEMIAFAKAKPNNLAYATGGPGSVPHLMMLDFLDRIGAEAVHIPTTGAGPMAQALLNGTVQVFIESPAIATANEFPIMAALSDQRIPILPDVPTFKELGYDNMRAFSAGGIVLPAGTPDAIVSKVSDACAKTVEGETYQSTMKKLNGTPRYLPGDAFKKMFQQDWDDNFKKVEKAGMLAK